MSPTYSSRLRRPIGAAIYAAGAAAATLLTAAVTPAAAQSLTPIAQIGQPSTTQANITSFDISFVDPTIHVYVLGDRTQQAVDVVNTSSNQMYMLAGKGLFTGATGNNNTSGPDGVMIVNHNQIWAGDGDSTLKILSLSTGQLIKSISTGGQFRVDEMCFDPVDQVAAAANNADTPPFVTIFNVTTQTIIKKITFDGTNGTPLATNGIEQCQYDPRTGNFWISVPEINGPGDNSAAGGVSVISPAGNVTATYVIPVTSCRGPQGMAIGPAPQILEGCNGGPGQAANGFPTAVINDGSTGGTPGSVIFTLLNEAGSDEVAYDSFSNTYQLAESSFNPPPPNGTASCSGTITAGPQHLGIVGAVRGTEGTSVVDGLYNCPTSPHGTNHSVAVDVSDGHVFVPIAGTSGAHLCSLFGGLDNVGCIMVFQATGNNNGPIVWRNTNGDVNEWQMNGATLEGSVNSGSVATSWSVVGKGDFAGDGNTDLLWRDNAGNVAIWLEDNGTVTSTVSLGGLPTSWSVAGTGDFNGDGKTDILWRNSNGDIAIWLMDGGTITNANSAGVGNLSTSWQVAGVHGNQIVWKDTSGNLGVWSMNGTSVASGTGLGNAGSSWAIVGVGDFAGFNNAGIVFEDASGNLAMWQLGSNGQVASSAGLGQLGANWTLAQTSDLNMDGKSDLVWRDSSGNTAVWLMSGNTITSSSSLGDVPTSWTIQGGATN